MKDAIRVALVCAMPELEVCRESSKMGQQQLKVKDSVYGIQAVLSAQFQME